MGNKHSDRRRAPIRSDNTASMRARKKRLYDENPHCYYCGVRVQIGIPDKSPTLATIEHLYSRVDIRRVLIHHSKNTVLSCHKCNNLKAKEANEMLLKNYDSLGNISEIDLKQYAIPAWKFYLLRIWRKLLKFIKL